jgi:uncharacterized membrane protein YjgN (DUF898 family)
MSWYYQDGNQQVGPVSKAQLQDLIKSRKIDRNTLVRSSPQHAWRSLADTIRSGPAEEQAPALGNQSETHSTSEVVVLDTEIPFRFKGTGGEYFKIWIVNVLLSFVTFGIYSAWAKVRRKQYFYGNTSIYGASFRYMADPVKILKGRLIVFLAFGAYAVLNQFYPSISIVLFIVLLIFFPFFAVRSLTFNARNSSWRNIRFNFTGSYGGAVKVFILWPLIVPLTFGMAFPYVVYRQKKFIVEHSAYGTTPFSFHAKAKDYYAVFLKFLIPIVAIAAVIALIAYNFWQSVFIFLLSGFLPLLIIAIYLFAFVYFSVKLSNLLYNSGALREHRFKATMNVGKYAFIVLTNTLATVLTVGLFHPVAQMRAYRYKIENLALLPGGNLDQFSAAEFGEAGVLGEEVSDFLDFDFGL